MGRNGNGFIQFGNSHGVHVLAFRVHREWRPILLVALSFRAGSGVQVVVALAAEGQLGHHLAVNHLQLGVDDLEHGSTALGGHLIIAVLDLPAGFAGISGFDVLELDVQDVLDLMGGGHLAGHAQDAVVGIQGHRDGELATGRGIEYAAGGLDVLILGLAAAGAHEADHRIGLAALDDHLVANDLYPSAAAAEGEAIGLVLAVL